VPGVFACGNVLHVHDLVDYVSEEAAAAGAHAAAYVQAGEPESERKSIPVVPEGGVRYTVPATIDPASMDEKLTVRFRVGAVKRNVFESVYVDGARIAHKKRPIVAPGEMEQVILKKTDLEKHPDAESIRVVLEEA